MARYAYINAHTRHYTRDPRTHAARASRGAVLYLCVTGCPAAMSRKGTKNMRCPSSITGRMVGLPFPSLDCDRHPG
eukprot:3395584-Prymnesium_polylepis.2